MSNITSTLSIRVNDDGFAQKLQADAVAARRLGVSAGDLSKLRAGASTSKLVSQFERLGNPMTSVGEIAEFAVAMAAGMPAEIGAAVGSMLSEASPAPGGLH